MGCNCSGSCGCDCGDLTLLIPPDGQTGLSGDFGGNSAPYLFSTATTATPAATYLNFNSTNLSTATILYVNKLDRDSEDLSNWIAQIGASTNTNKALLRVFEEHSNENFADFRVTGTSLAGNVYSITVVSLSLSQNSPFANNDNVVLTYAQSGDAGTNGSAGQAGTTILYNNNVTANSGSNGGTFTTQAAKTYTILANELDANGDMVSLSSDAVNYDLTYNTSVAVNKFRIQITNNAVVYTQEYVFQSHNEQARIEVRMNRISNTTARMIVTIFAGALVNYLGTADMAGIDFTTSTVANVQASTTSAEVNTLNFVVVKYNI